MIANFYATIVTANIRDVDGCDSDTAVEAIYAAAEKAAQAYAEKNSVVLTIEPHSPAHDRRGITVNVSHDLWGSGADPEEQIAAHKAAEDIAEYLDRAVDLAIEAGDWED